MDDNANKKKERPSSKPLLPYIALVLPVCIVGMMLVGNASSGGRVTWFSDWVCFVAGLTLLLGFPLLACFDRKLPWGDKVSVVVTVLVLCIIGIVSMPGLLRSTRNAEYRVELYTIPAIHTALNAVPPAVVLASEDLAPLFAHTPEFWQSVISEKGTKGCTWSFEEKPYQFTITCKASEGDKWSYTIQATPRDTARYAQYYSDESQIIRYTVDRRTPGVDSATTK